MVDKQQAMYFNTNLLNARVGRAVDACPRASVGRDDDDGTIAGFRAPSLHHVHQLYKRVGGGGHLKTIQNDSSIIFIFDFSEHKSSCGTNAASPRRGHS